MKLSSRVIPKWKNTLLSRRNSAQVSLRGARQGNEAIFLYAYKRLRFAKICISYRSEAFHFQVGDRLPKGMLRERSLRSLAMTLELGFFQLGECFYTAEQLARDYSNKKYFT